jgi:hypothetical protein
MSRLTLWEWRLDPRFRAWHQQRIKALNEDDYQLMIRKHVAQAMRGSVKSAQIVIAARGLELRAAGAFGRGPEGDNPLIGDVTTNYQVNVLVAHDPIKGIVPNVPTVNLLVPRPPALEPGTTS